MNKFFQLLLVLMVFTTGSANSIEENKKYETLGLLWGFLKYHHPEVSKGKFNWDEEYIKMFDKTEEVNSQDQLNRMYKDWILSFGKIPNIKSKQYDKNIFTKNEDYKWFDNSGFDDQLIAILTSLKNAKHTAGDYYVSIDKLNKFLNFQNEKGYSKFNVEVKSHRLLVLYSFWNAMQYFNINKYTFDKDWNEVLHELTPVFVNAVTNPDYQIAKARLIRYIDDSHSDFYNPAMHAKMNPYALPLGLLNVNDSLLIYSTQNKEITEQNGLKVGDVIVAIDGKSIRDLVKEKIAPYHSCSNATVLKRYSYFLGYNDKEYAEFSVVGENGTIVKKKVQFYQNLVKGGTDYIKVNEQYKLPENIAYLDLEYTNEKAIDSFFKVNMNKKGIIIDLRKAPKHFIEDKLANYLYPEKKVFVKIMGSTGVPGLSEYDLQAPLKMIKNPFKAGSNNKNSYKGKVVVLVNRRTQSRMEYMAMMLQQVPGCITIGEQTAGVFMNILEYKLPDGDSVFYTGMQAFYPDDELAFKKGVRLDKEIKQSALNYDPELYIKEAIKIIQ